MKLGSPQPRPLTGLESRVKLLLGRANWFGGQIVLGANLFSGQLVSGEFFIGGYFVSGGFYPRWLFDGWRIAR